MSIAHGVVLILFSFPTYRQLVLQIEVIGRPTTRCFGPVTIRRFEDRSR